MTTPPLSLLYGLLYLLLISFGNSALAAPQFSFDNNLIAHWPLDASSGSTANDAQGSNDAILFNSPQWQPNSGKVDGAMRFDGSNDYLDTPTSTAFSLSNFSLAAWIKHDTQCNGWNAILEHNRYNDNHYGLFTTPSDCRAHFRWTTWFRSGSNSMNGVTSLADNQWHHILATHDASSRTVKLYVDGVLEASETNVTASLARLDKIRIGSKNDGGETFLGSLDEIRIYNRALSAADAQSLFSNTGTPNPPSNNDADGDGISDDADNCPADTNANQADLDNDGFGDLCDTDKDGDNVLDTVDNCPINANANQANLDNDAFGDVCDTDIDGDSILNTSDNCPVVANTNQNDLDNDGFGDLCDTDKDGDNIPDSSDNCPVNVNNNQQDSDNDGIGDVCDSTPGGNTDGGSTDGGNTGSFPFDTNLIAYWPLDASSGSTAKDAQGSNDAILFNSPQWQPNAGKVDGAMRFDGSNDYLDTPTSTAFSLSNFSLAAWIKHDTQCNGWNAILEHNRYNDNHYGLFTTPSDCRAHFRWTTWFRSGSNSMNGVTSLADNQWHHILATHDASSRTVKLYVDGVLEASETNVTASLARLDKIRIGSKNDGGETFLGSLDEIRIYNRALSAADAQSLFSNTGTPNPPSNNDADGDGISDDADNCPADANANQADLDNDGFGDLCDTDKDGDNVLDTVDNCPINANANQANLDNDAFGDVCDTDIDGDSILNTSDNCPVVANTNQNDLDNDGFGDLCDTDKDGDNIPDSSDNCPVNVNNNQQDSDNDGIGDVCDSTPGGNTDGGSTDGGNTGGFPFDTNLIAYWPLDASSGSTAKDAQGSNDAILFNSPQWQPNAGKVDGAMRFDGSNDYLDTPTSTAFSLSNFSLAAWIKHDTQCNGWNAILEHNRYNDNHYGLFTTPSDCRAHFRWTTWFRSGSNSMNGVTSLADNQWHHILATHDASSRTVKLYVDGVLEASETNVTASLARLDKIRIGSKNDGGETFLGSLDEIRIYNRALSAADAQALFSNTGTSNPPANNDPDGDGIFDDDNCPTTANPDQTDSDNDGIGDACDSTVNPSTVKILPLGNSITQTYITELGYRYHLWKLLLENNYDFDFIGSLTKRYNFGNGDVPLAWPNYLGQSFDQDHEGHGGFRVDQIDDNLNGWLANYTPDIVLLHLGTNDILQSQSTESTVNELTNVISKLRSDNPNVKILLAKILPTSWNNTIGQPAINGVIGLNNQLDSLANTLSNFSSPVAIVDMYSGFSINDHTYDGTHPNLTGDTIMANRWFDALINNGFIQ